MGGAGATAAVGGGTGSAGIDALAAPANIIVNLTQTSRGTTPLILPGLFTASEAEGALPVDRVFFTYGYFDRFRVGGATGLVPVSPPMYTIDPRSFVNQDNRIITVILQTPDGHQVASTVFPAKNTIPGMAPQKQTSTITVPFPQTVFGQQATAGQGLGQSFNLNRYEAGLEKTFLDGRASFYLNVPVLDATDNNTGQGINGFGDISAGFKFVLLGDQETGSAITAGFTASAPTGRDTIVVTRINQAATIHFLPPQPFTSQGSTIVEKLTFDPNNPPTLSPPQMETARINPTYLQPWLGGLLVQDRLFVQGYSGAIVPTDDRIPVYLNENLVVGYEAYRGPHDAVLASVAPFVGAQVLIPVSGSEFRFPDQVFLSAGLGVRLGQRLVFTGSYVTPVAGPRAFDGGVTAGVNFLF
jgi:hypothetical protein